MTSNIKRRVTKQVHIGNVAVGGDAPISVQTMTKTDTRDIKTTVAQIHELEQLGCDIVRLAVVDESATTALKEIRKQVHIPLVADIHYNHKLAIQALNAGIDGLRINPGNIGGISNVKEVAKAAGERNVPIRIGVNCGSLEKDIAEKFSGAIPEALVESAMRHVRILENIGYTEIKISVKASNVMKTIEAYRLLSGITDYPLHLGVTEAGTLMPGSIRSSVAMGILLAEGIGDTIRVSLTNTPENEIMVGLELLRSLELRERGCSVISCPTCGRCEVNVITLARQVEIELEKFYRKYPENPKPVVAVMGCMVNGPGEAQNADIAISGGKEKFALYINGNFVLTVKENNVVNTLIEEVSKWQPPTA